MTNDSFRKTIASAADDLRAQFDDLLQIDEIEGDELRWSVTLRCRSVESVGATPTDVTLVDAQTVELVFAADYPAVPPEIIWKSKIFHPNVNTSGLVHVNDLGIRWQPDLQLEILFERLWDAARFAYLQPETATNPLAKRWIQDRPAVDFPIDPRAFEAREPEALRNVFCYRRIGDPRARLPSTHKIDDSVVFIGDEPRPQPVEVPVAREANRVVDAKIVKTTGDDVIIID